MIIIMVLAAPDFSKEFIVETNASRKGLRVVLMQLGHLITFLSKVLSLQNQGKFVYEQELMAIVLALKNGDIIYLVAILKSA